MSGVKVVLGPMREAAAQYGQKLGRAPAGAKGSVAPDTLLRKDGRVLMIDTPFLASGVEILEGQWSGVISVQPKAFSNLLNECAKQWRDIGGDMAEVSLSFSDGMLTLRWTDGKSSRSRSMVAKKVK
jgi:hypothetical protein